MRIKLMNLLILDTETTGLPPEGQLIEVAAILYSVEHRAILQQISTLLPVQANPQFGLNGISAELSQEVPIDAHTWFESWWMGEADYAIAFNASFDKQFLPSIDLPWLCALEDFDYKPYKRQSLVQLAVAHHVPICNAHRALDDCRLLAEIFSRREDLEEMIEKALRPKVLVKALVTYEQRHLASQAGFLWDKPELILKAWARRMAEEDTEQLNFDWEIVDAPVRA
jgi:DNA polymerase-3 subunit epsilon